MSKNVVILSVALILTTFNIFAQTKQPVEEVPSNCEYVRVALDNSLYETTETEDSNVIFIFRLGKKETSKTLNNRRMDTVEKHIKFRVPDFDRYIVAVGRKNNGLGKVEIYVKGKLTWELFAKKNKDLGYDCLEEPF